MTVQLEFARPPSALRYMFGALLPSPGVGATPPAITATWHGATGEPSLAAFRELSALEENSRFFFPLYLHTVSMRLQMAVLTQRTFPIPIWRVLQTRNHIVAHRPFPAPARVELEVCVAGQRVLEKGVEFDLHCVARADGEPVWEAHSAFYTRGRFAGANPVPPTAAPPPVTQPPHKNWRMPRDGKLRFGGLTGDYNGIHLSDAYARTMGFGGAFLHPQRTLGHCLARLGIAGNGPFCLDVWLRGPVCYGAAAALACETDRDEVRFALTTNGDARPALVGRVTPL